MTRPVVSAVSHRRLTLLGIVVLAALLRGWAAWQLPVDFDEPVYVRAAYDYATAIRSGQVSAIVDYPQNSEHPPLVKLLYGAGVLALGRDASWNAVLFLSRGISVAFGVLAVWLLVLVDPLAGGLLAVHTLVTKYTAQAYLEALPLAAALAALLALRRVPASTAALQTRGRQTRFWGLEDRHRPADADGAGEYKIRPYRAGGWLWVSAACLGVAAAGKLSYPVLVLLPLLYLAAWDKRLPWSRLLGYGAVALLAFWLLDPALWHDPLGRLAGQLLYFGRYSQSAAVQAVGYPWYQPLLWLSSNWPVRWHPTVFLYYGLDALIFWAALAGVGRGWHRERWLVVWLAGGIVLLLAWPTKWPQYTLALAPGFCLAAAGSLRRLRAWIAEQEDYWPWVRELFPHPSKFFWIAPGLVILGLGAFYAGNKVQAELGQRGWLHLTAATAPLPSDAVHALAAAEDGRLIVGTDAGAAIWTPGQGAAQATWTIVTTANSGLADDQVLAVAVDGADLWLGTTVGLSRDHGGAWQTYHAAQLGLAGDRITALARDSRGQIWAGTDSGAAYFDGKAWHSLAPAGAGPAGEHVTALAVVPAATGDTIWFGTASGLSRFDSATGAWTSAAAPAALGGITCLYAGSGGRLWAGTGSDGLWLWDGRGWTDYTIANTNLPLNSISAVYESAPGFLWIGTTYSVQQSGGLLSTFNGRDWQTYIPERTGYSGGEVTAMAADSRGSLWIATRTRGIDIFQIAKQ